MKPASSAPPPRTLEAAVLLALLGLFLLMPPVVALFAVPATIAGVPLIVAYMFGVWAALIVGAALIARRMAPRRQEGASGPDAGG